jgi:hypothetical protein
LRISVDSTDVRRADGDLATMSGTAGRTTAAVDRLAASNNRLADAVASSHKPTIDAVKYINQLQHEIETVGKSSLQLKALEIRMAAARAPTAELAQEIRSLGAQMLVAERNAQRAAGTPTSGITGVGGSSRLAGHHVQNLAFQFQDMFVGLASGQKPMTVFMQQGSQIAGIMGQAGLGVGGFVKEIGRMAAGMAAAVALNPLFLGLAAAAGVAFVAFKDFQGEVEKSGALKEYAATLGLTAEEMKKLGPVTITAMDVVNGLWKTISDGLGLESVFASIGGFFSTLFRNVADVAADVTAAMYGLFVGTYRGIIAVWDQLPAAFADLVISAMNAMIRFTERGINGAIDLINGLISKANKILSTLKMPTIGMISDVNIPEIENQYKGAANKAGAAFVGEIKKATSQARGALGSIGDTIGENIISAAKQRLEKSAEGIISDRTAKKAKDAAGKAGKSAGEKFSDQMLKVIGDMNAMTQAMGADFMRDFAKAGAQSFKEMNDDLNRSIDERLRKQQDILEENLRTATKGAKLIGDAIGGSISKGVDQMMRAITRGFPKFAQDIGGLFKGIMTSFDTILGGLGSSIKEVSAGFGIGGAAATITGGSALGGSIGGAVGSMVGKQVLGKALGAAAGPIGAIAGGILGGVVGGLFKKTKQASATIAMQAGKLDVAGVVGNNAQFKQTANTLAGAVVSGLNNAAGALGAEMTKAFNISIGQRKFKFIVDLMGQGRTKGAGTMSFASEEEAVKFAIDKAIRDGVLGGLRSGTQRLLNGMGDVEDRLAKAVDFENVFKAMEAEIDPVGTALTALDKRFAGLIETFREAGATAEEFATLEKYYQRERIKTIEEANRVAIEKTREATDVLISVYERIKGLTDSLTEFRTSLAEQLMTAQQIYQASKAKFDEIAKLAAQGNEDAISKLVGVSQRYLDAAKQFLTPEEYNREIENVMKAVDLAIEQTKSMEEYAKSQLDALNLSVEGINAVNDSVISVADAIKNLKDALTEQNKTFAETTLNFSAVAVDAAVTSTWEEAARLYRENAMGGNFRAFASGGDFNGGLRLVGENGPELEATGPSRIYNAAQTAEILSGGTDTAQQIANLREEMRLSLYTIAKNTGKTTDQLKRWDGDGMPEVRTWTTA